MDVWNAFASWAMWPEVQEAWEQVRVLGGHLAADGWIDVLVEADSQLQYQRVKAGWVMGYEYWGVHFESRVGHQLGKPVRCRLLIAANFEWAED
ncbi:hypothetical protein [Streptomyces sp. RKCA744]|uniref:hypothetical protein n=1 Tax=Streptomyces sp. RKCA744 TaxID=2959340 RepID=UPI00209DE093|nr:hypothetical protein [Streptomyces sp. RKCA744]MCO8308802.1 hypothetical protein [Streptomyces sp. RKCA744]